MSQINLACFISSHGYGHAARSSAVAEQLLLRNSGYHFHIFSRTPRWFFEATLEPESFTYHPLTTDIGLVQKNPMREDVPATIARLQEWLPFTDPVVDMLAQQLHALDCRAVVCDISPLGLAAAARAGLTSVLLENFTWDWIYEAYLTDFPDLKPFIMQMRQIYESIDVHIQTRPFCGPQKTNHIVNPVSRRPRNNRSALRRQLRIPDGVPVILLTMGGIRTRHAFLEQLSQTKLFYFVIPHDTTETEYHNNMTILPHHSSFYHPDLVHAADITVGKLGYSTVAEVYNSGGRMAYLTRPAFRESSCLAQFVERYLPSVHIAQHTFTSGDWIDYLFPLIEKDRDPAPTHEDGAWQAAAIIDRYLFHP